MYTPRFLFVKDPSASTSTPQDKKHHKSLIQRHAQVQSIVSRRERTVPSVSSIGRSRKPLTASGVDNNRGSISSSRATQSPLLPKQRASHRCDKSAKMFEEGRLHLGPSAHARPAGRNPWRTAIPITPIISFDILGQPSNPPVVVDEQVYQYLQYYLSEAHERLLCSTGLLKSSRRDSLLDSASIMIQSCFKNELLMYALLANMSTMLPEMEPGSNFPSSAYYCYQAIKALRRRLSMSLQPDESVIIGLWHLISAEKNRGDCEAAFTHLRGAHTILCHLRQSGHPLSPQYAALLEASDALLVIDADTRRLS